MKQIPIAEMPKVYEINMVRPTVCSLAFDKAAREAARKAFKGAKREDFQMWLKEGY
jgi:hypothetical protein